MKALQITSMKDFMNKLLTSDFFDIFLLRKALISTAVTYEINGRIEPAFFPIEERNSETIPYEYAQWSDQRELCFNLIKGKRTPLSFKFELLLKPEHTNALLAQKNNAASSAYVDYLVLNIHFDGTAATLTSGVAYNTFILNKDVDAIWDKALSKFLSDKKIAFEER